MLFLGSQTLSLLGTSLVQYAIFWYITLTTQSGATMTVYIICGFLPTFFLSPFAGVWADRFSRRRLIAASDAAIAAATLVLALLFMAGYDSLWLLYVMAAVRAAGSGVQGPAVSALIPDIVPQEQLTRVNGANSSIQAIVTLVSPMLSGALFSQAPLTAIFLIDVATAAAAIAILLALVRTPVHAKAREAQATSYFADLAEGFRYIAGQAYIKAFFAFSALFFVLSAPVSFLTPLQVARTFGDDIWYLTAIEVGFSVGMILGGALTAAWGGFAKPCAHHGPGDAAVRSVHLRPRRGPGLPGLPGHHGAERHHDAAVQHAGHGAPAGERGREHAGPGLRRDEHARRAR